MKDLLNYIDSIYPLSPGLRTELKSVLKEKIYLKKEYLLIAGNVCTNISFVKKGLVRCFYTKESTEVCSWFMKEGDMILSVQSFFEQKVSFESIQALEDCVVYSMEYSELQNMYGSFPELNYIGRVLTEKYYSLSEERSYALRMQRAPFRYKHLMENYPELILRIQSKHIASYLGVTEETLSRIRSRKY